MKKMFAITISIFMIALSGCNSEKGDWEIIGKIEKAYVFGDSKSFDSKKRIGWIKYEYIEPIAIDNKVYDRKLLYTEANCSLRKIRFVEQIFRNSKDDKIYLKSTSPSPWINAIPDTIGNGILEWLCR